MKEICALLVLMTALALVGCSEVSNKGMLEQEQGAEAHDDVDSGETSDSADQAGNAADMEDSQDSSAEPETDDSFETASDDFASQYCIEGAQVFICGSVVKVTYDS
ncbi:hypothetical protein GF345_04535, partial [Candidatus Woesearchaeota archaeon]|nr:hypothetical protein [Candidatus Woesearchaeota archaeon]